MRFSAPPHTSEVYLPSGPVSVKDGFASVDNPTDGDLRGLAAAGFRPAADEKVAQVKSDEKDA